MSPAEWKGFVDRFRTIAILGHEEFGLTVSIHPHAAGFMDFEAEIERLLAEMDSRGQLANASIGQGKVVASPLQMAMVTATLANGGKSYFPR